MPNFTPKGWQPWNDRVLYGIDMLLLRRAQDVNKRIPITPPELQQMILPVDTLRLIKELQSIHQVKNIPTYNHVTLRLRQADGGMLAAVEIKVHPGVHRLDENATKTVNLGDYPYKAPNLIDWVVRAKAERDKGERISATVKEFLKRHDGFSLWHVTTRWPTLKLGFNQETRERAATLPRSSRKYSWGTAATVDYAWWVENRDWMAEIDEALLEASMLQPPDRSYMPQNSLRVEAVK